MTRFLLLCIPLIFATSCWHSSARINYQKARAFTELPNDRYDEIGPVTGSGWIHYIGVCQRAAETAMKEAIAKTRQLGGNAMGKVRWIADEVPYTTPTCEAGFLIYWWGGSAEVVATAIKVRNKGFSSSEVFRLRDGASDEEEARRLMAELYVRR